MPRRIEDAVSPEALRRLRAFRAAAEAALPGQVVEVLLFGSRARGEAQEDSDYDLAVLLRGVAGHRGQAREVLFDIGWPHAAEGFQISAIPLPEDYLNPDRTWPTPLGSELRRDGLPIA